MNEGWLIAVTVILSLILVSQGLILFILLTADGTAFKEAPLPLEEEDAPASPAEEAEPFPVDVEHPPYTTVYQPRVRADGTLPVPPNCLCHKIPVAVGDKVVLYPIPGTDGKAFRVFHQEAVGLVK